jgi:hypothetical protein
LRFVWLNTWQAERSYPLDRLASACNNFGTFRKPLLDAIGIAEQVSDTLDGNFSQVLCGLVKIAISFIEPLVL